MAFFMSVIFGSLIGLSFLVYCVKYSLFAYDMLHGFINFSLEMQRL